MYTELWFTQYNNNIKGSVPSAVISTSMSAQCGAFSGCDGDGVQVGNVVVHILNKQCWTSEKGRPPVCWLGEVLIFEE